MKDSQELLRSIDDACQDEDYRHTFDHLYHQDDPSAAARQYLKQTKLLNRLYGAYEMGRRAALDILQLE